MGWHYSNQSRSDLIVQLTAPKYTAHTSTQILAHALCGNVLWTVAEVTAKTEGAHHDLSPGQSLRYIRCDLLGFDLGGRWGYKSSDESLHPYYYSCPLPFLDMAPERSAVWRKCVRAYHTRRRTPIA